MSSVSSQIERVGRIDFSFKKHYLFLSLVIQLCVKIILVAEKEVFNWVFNKKLCNYIIVVM